MPIYNKLVRDRIPEIIENTGKRFTKKILNDDEYIIELKKKSFEELREYMKSDNNRDSLEELADLLEIIHSLAEYHGASLREVEKIRERKAIERGQFRDKIFLINVEDD